MSRNVITHTGLAIEHLEEQQAKAGVNCYLCKRTTSEHSLIAKDEESEFYEIKMNRITFENPHGIYRYFLCQECLLLLTALHAPEECGLVVEQ